MFKYLKSINWETYIRDKLLFIAFICFLGAVMSVFMGDDIKITAAMYILAIIDMFLLLGWTTLWERIRKKNGS